MSQLRRRAALAAALVLATFAAVVGVALANNNTPPTLRTPHKGARVHAGVIRLTVYDPGLSGDSAPVYVTISNRRSLDRYGHLKEPKGCNSRCDFFPLKRVKGHPGLWRYTAKYNFPGYWAVTPGRYYWQANHVAPACDANGCELVSPIRSFRVVR
jgi:hypothetical protein